MRILHIDENHSALPEGLHALGLENDFDYTASKEEVMQKIHHYQGLVLRSRFPIDATFIDAATDLRFIARVGSGLENIDTTYAQSKGIHIISAPEGNSNAVAEHATGMILTLFNKLIEVSHELKEGVWKRESNRGEELEGKTVGLIGYGNTGKALARKLKGFDVKVLCYDIHPDVGDGFAQQVSLNILQKEADIISLHVPETPLTTPLIDRSFINAVAKPFWLINTARGKNVVTKDLIDGLKKNKILGACLDVLEYEKSSFEQAELSQVELTYLLNSEKVILSPHIAGWSHQSKIKLAKTIVEKVKKILFKTH
jgi:D-3-phosphoglycerate dehydrogenase